MSRYVFGQLKGYISPEQIVNVLKTKYPDVRSTLQKYDNGKLSEYRFKFEKIDDSETWDCESAYITFSDPEDYEFVERTITYIYDNIIEYDEEMIHYYLNNNYFESLRMITNKCTHIHLAYCGNAVDIIKYLCKCFGGWFYIEEDENDALWIEKEK